MTLAHNPNHVADGLEALIYDLRKPKVQALAASYLTEVQEIEDAYWFLYLHTMIRDAFGQALDRLGALVTQPRENRTDDVYRVWILARALVLRSSGRPEELIAIARMVLPPTARVVILEEYPAAITLRIDGVIDGDLGHAIAALLRDGKANGVRMLVSWTGSLTPFRYAPAGVAIQDSPNGYGNGGYASVS